MKRIMLAVPAGKLIIVALKSEERLNMDNLIRQVQDLCEDMDVPRHYLNPLTPQKTLWLLQNLWQKNMSHPKYKDAMHALEQVKLAYIERGEW